jgi:hypothetical protein
MVEPSVGLNREAGLVLVFVAPPRAGESIVTDTVGTASKSKRRRRFDWYMATSFFSCA